MSRPAPAPGAGPLGADDVLRLPGFGGRVRSIGRLHPAAPVTLTVEIDAAEEAALLAALRGDGDRRT